MGNKKLLIITILFFSLYSCTRESINISQCLVTEYGLKVVISLEKLYVPSIKDIYLEYDENMGIIFFEPNEIVIEKKTDENIILNINKENMKIHMGIKAKLSIGFPGGFVWSNILFKNELEEKYTYYEFPLIVDQNIQVEIIEQSFIYRK